ncbi:origin recognition complex subunit 1 [Phakopsora pachyrhizi]|nr:origin recognition complex subunit 1 [Phakopsora pachyrhizi]
MTLKSLALTVEVPQEKKLPRVNANHQTLVRDDDPWARARQILHVSSTPDWLPCREEEFAELEAALEDSIEENIGCCIYISGVPGTGKTATVHSVINSLRSKVDQGELQSFRFFEINGMKVTEPNQAFALFWEFIDRFDEANGNCGSLGVSSVKKRYNPREALRNLENYFNTPSPNRQTCVLLVDELDQLVTKKQEVIYNFFNWPNQPHSRLIVIAIANKMDLPETELNGKIRSRLGSNRIQFKPYNHHQLKEILESRLMDLSETIFLKDSIQWVSKKIASLTGDVRRALDLCRSGLERVEKENQIRRANGQESRMVKMISSGTLRFIKQLSLHQSIMLLSISKAIKMAGIPEVEMGDVISRHVRFSNSLGITPEPTHEDLKETISSLENMNLILNESNSFDYFSRIRLLDVREEEIGMIFKSDKRFSCLAI